jgi:serine/threonine protein kinase
MGDEEKAVLKELWYDDDYPFRISYYEQFRMDALVSERLSSNPRIVDIYGYCGVSILSEYLPNGDIEDLLFPVSGYVDEMDLKEEHELVVKNEIPVSDKLTIATEVASAIAVLHGYPKGKYENC